MALSKPVSPRGQSNQDEIQYLLRIRSAGLPKAYNVNDSRSDCVRGLWPGDSMGTDDENFKAGLKQLAKYLVADTYGSVQVVHYARQTYNNRR